MKKMIIMFLVLGWVSLSYAANAPVLFFTDLESGPKTGGENNNGAFVTLYGNNFGTSPSVTVGGGSVSVKLAPASYLWYQKMTIQLGANAATGNIVVTNSNGSSNGLPFTVRSGNIYFAGTQSGDKSGIAACKNAMAAGDICYVRNGVNQTGVDDYNADLSIGNGTAIGAAGNPIALVAYPGAASTIGNTSAGYAIRNPQVGSDTDYWIIAGFKIVGSGAGMDLWHTTGWRVIGNEMTCPGGAGQSACFHTDTLNNVYFYGNYVHNVGDTAGSIDKYYHAVYFTTNTNHVWVGWNEVAPNPNKVTSSGGCRAIQFYSTGGSNQYDLHVHDNRIHDAICDGINFSTVDPSKGTVEAYNNVIYHVGTGPDPYNGSSNYSCVTVGGGGSGNVQVYNNTLYDCGSRKTSDAGALDPTGPYIAARNNIIYQLSGESYINANTNASGISGGSNNIWYGAGNGPSQTTGNLNSDPKLVNPSGYDFHLQSSSPAVNAGTSISGLTYDLDGTVRGSTFDIGAYEYASGGAPPSNVAPAPPTGLTAR